MSVAAESKRVAYLVNVYPAPSHSFIRREILALEELGWEVKRFSIRRTESPLHDVSDHRESKKTEVLLEAGPLRLAQALILCFMASPVRFMKAASMAWRLGRISDVGLIRHVIYLAEACYLFRRLRGLNILHLHAHFGTNSATVALLCFLVGGPKYSFTAHGPEEFDKPTVLGLTEKVEHAAFVVTISQFGRSQLFRWSEYADWSKIHVIRCGLDAAYLDREHDAVFDYRQFVCVGRLCEQKGQLLLVEAFGSLIRSGMNSKLVLVGDGPMRRDIESRIAAQGIQDHVRITGWASGVTVQEELSAACAMVLPSFAEGLPVVIMEALAMERPVISTYVAGIPELIRPGKNGWLVPAGDVDAIANAMREALEIPVDQLKAMGRAGRERVLERHSIKTEVAKLAELFRISSVG